MRSILLTTVAFAAALPLSAHAEAPPDVLPEVVVTATRIPAIVAETPGARIIDRRTLDQRIHIEVAVAPDCPPVLADPGQPILLEDPGYFGARKAFEMAELKVLPIAVDAQGLRTDLLHADRSGARTLYVTPSHQYPTGVTLSLQRRLELIAWARERNGWIIEDDYDSQFHYEGLPTACVQGLDNYQRTSKVGYAVVEADLGDRTLLSVGGDVMDSDPKGSTWGGIPLLDSAGNFNRMPRSFNNGAQWAGWRQYVRTGFTTLEHTFANDWIAKLQLNHQVNGYDAALAGAAAGNPDPLTGEGVSLWLGKYVGKTVSNAADFYVSGRFGLFGREHELVVGGSASRQRWTNTGYGPQAGFPDTVPDYRTWNGDIAEPQWQRTYDNNEVTRENGLYVVGRFDLADRHCQNRATQHLGRISALHYAQHGNARSHARNLDALIAPQQQSFVHRPGDRVVKKQDQHQFRHSADNGGIDRQQIPRDRATVKLAKRPADTNRQPGHGSH